MPPPKVTVPVRVETDPATLARSPGALDEAIAAALGKSVASSSDTLGDVGVSGTVVVTPSTVTWGGDGLADVPANVRADTERRLGTLVADAGEDATRRNAVRDPFAKPALDVQDAPAPKQVDAASVRDRLTGADVTDRGIAFLEIGDELMKGDQDAFRLALLGIQPDGSSPTAAVVQAMRDLARAKPQLFLQLLQGVLASGPRFGIERGAKDIYVDLTVVDIWAARLHGAAARVVEEVPEAKALRRRWEHDVPGLNALFGQAETLAGAYADLAAWLQKSSEPVEPGALSAIGARPGNLLSLQGLLARLADKPALEKLVPGLSVDLAENIRWIGEVANRIRIVDANLDVYEELFREAADSQPEVKVLRDIRAALVAQVQVNPLPNRDLLGKLRSESDRLYADWRGRALDRRQAKLESDLVDLRALADKLHEVGVFFDVGPVDIATSDMNDPRAPYLIYLTKGRAELEELADGIRAGSGMRRDVGELLTLSGRVAYSQVHLRMLTLWMGSLILESYTYGPNKIGWSDERASWRKQLNDLRVEWMNEWERPNFRSIQMELGFWGDQLTFIQDEMRFAVKRDLIAMIVIDITALIVTAGVGLAFEGLAAGELLIVEAGTFTLVSAGLREIAFGNVDAGDVIVEFVDNVMMFAAFRALGELATLGARAILPGRALAQYAFIVGTTGAIGVAFPVVVARLERGEWPQETGLIVGAGVVMTALGAAIGGPKALESLEALNAHDLVSELRALHRDSVAWERDFAVLSEQPDLPDPDFKKFKQRGVDLCQRGIRALKLLEALPESTLGRIGLTKLVVGDKITLGEELLKTVRSLERRTPSRETLTVADVGRRGVVEVSPGIFEYDSQLVSADDVAERLRPRGYEATGAGGGALVLRSTAPGGQTYRLVPRPVQLLLPPPSGAVASEGSLTLLAAAGSDAEATARQQLRSDRGPALERAAELEPGLVRALVVAEPEQLRYVAKALAKQLVDDGLAVKDADAVVAQLRILNAARLAPREKLEGMLLSGIGESARAGAKTILAGPDGDAVLHAARIDGGLAYSAVIAEPAALPAVLDTVAATLADAGVSKAEIDSARSGLEALNATRRASMLDPATQLRDAAGSRWRWTSDDQRALVGKLGGHLDLALEAVRAEEQGTLTRKLAELKASLEGDGLAGTDVDALLKLVGDLNTQRVKEAQAFAQSLVLRKAYFALQENEAYASQGVAIWEADARARFSAWKGKRNADALAWLAEPNRAWHEYWKLREEVMKSGYLSDLASHGGGSMLRQLWAAYEAPRPRPLKSNFEEYVKIIQRHYVGLWGEYQLAFWIGDDYIILKAPDALVTVPGTDLVAIRRVGDEIIIADQKEALSDKQLQAVNALTRNIAKNIDKDVKFWEELVKRGDPGLPTEFADAIDRLTAAKRELEPIVRKYKTRDALLAVKPQQEIDTVLKKYKIRRVVTSVGGHIKGVADEITKMGIEFDDVDILFELEGE